MTTSKPTKAKMKSTQISVEDTTKAKWDKLKTDFDGKQGDLFEKVLAHYIATANTQTEQTGGVDLSELEKYISSESTETGITSNQVIAGIIEKCKKDDSGSGVGKIAATIRDMMKLNVGATELYDRLAITGTNVFKETGSNQKTIRKYLEDNKDLIEAHHTAVGIEDATAHNRKVGVLMRNAKNK